MEWEVRMRKSSKSFACFYLVMQPYIKAASPGRGRPDYFLPSILWMTFQQNSKVVA